VKAAVETLENPPGDRIALNQLAASERPAGAGLDRDDGGRGGQASREIMLTSTA
jgi:hypothetical protein